MGRANLSSIIPFVVPSPLTPLSLRLSPEPAPAGDGGGGRRGGRGGGRGTHITHNTQHFNTSFNPLKNASARVSVFMKCLGWVGRAAKRETSFCEDTGFCLSRAFFFGFFIFTLSFFFALFNHLSHTSVFTHCMRRTCSLPPPSLFQAAEKWWREIDNK